VGPTSWEVVYANEYDLDVWNDPSDYDNTDTDVLAARVKSKPLGPVTLGATYASHRDSWWISWLGTNEDPFLDEYIAESGSTSDWFGYSKSEQWIAGDASWEAVPSMLNLAAEYSAYSYAGRWDMGNRETVQGDDYANGAIDVPTGDMGGSYLIGVASGGLAELLNVRLSLEHQAVDGMDAGEEYISYEGPAWAQSPVRQLTEVRFADSPLAVNVYGAAPERSDLLFESDVLLTLGIFGLRFEYDRDGYEWTYPESLAGLEDLSWEGDASRFAVWGRSDIMPEQVWVELEYESLTYDVDAGPWQPYDTGEVIGRAGFSFRKDWDFVVDLRHVTYQDVPADEGSDDESFWNPYGAIIWNPRKNIEVRLGYGVNPTSYADTPIEGRGNGRERWLSQYMWDNSAVDVVGAERALEDARVVGLMAVIAF
jgi:hypothetical protein